MVRRGVAFGDRCGRTTDRPCRSRHRQIAVSPLANGLGVDLEPSAVALIVQPPSRTQATIRRRHSRVNGAFGWTSSVRHEPSGLRSELWKTHILTRRGTATVST